MALIDLNIVARAMDKMADRISVEVSQSIERGFEKAAKIIADRLEKGYNSGNEKQEPR